MENPNKPLFNQENGKALVIVAFLFMVYFTACSCYLRTQAENIGNIRSVCRWTDTRYFDRKSGTFQKDTPLHQWPFGHPVQVYADQDGNLWVTVTTTATSENTKIRKD